MNNKSDIKAFKMFGNLYFVGSTAVSVHIIETEAGLVMIDTGYPDMYDQILVSMQELNLDPKKIRAIIHTHGHIDHFGCTVKLKALSGAKTYIGRPDNDIANGKLDLSWAKEIGIDGFETFDADVLVDDGDVLTFGKTKIRCVFTPGHTDGVISLFVNIEEGDESIIAAMHGGIGTNSMTKDFLDEYGLSYDCRDTFRKGLHALKSEHVDLVMGNHPGQNDTEGKLQKVLNNEPIVDPTEWQRFLIMAENNLDAMLANE